MGVCEGADVVLEFSLSFLSMAFAMEEREGRDWGTLVFCKGVSEGVWFVSASNGAETMCVSNALISSTSSPYFARLFL